MKDNSFKLRKEALLRQSYNDQIMNVSHLWNSIYGNEDLKKRLISEISSGRFVHAHIIEGPKNSGKTLLTKTIAAAMAKTDADVKKITSDASPDIIEISLQENKKSIGVEAVRDMKLEAYIKPNDMDFKFFIIKSADRLTIPAMNALLKLIEEPPIGVYIFLLCENLSSLLPTIRSRAQIIRMQSFTQEELSSLLLEHSADARMLAARDKEAFDIIVRSSGGAYGEALLKIVETEMKEWDVSYLIVDILELISNRNRKTLLVKINAMPFERKAFSDSVFLMRLAVRDIIAYRSTKGDCEYLFPRSEKTAYFAGKISLDRLLKISDALVNIEKTMSLNTNVQNAKSLLYTQLSEV